MEAGRTGIAGYGWSPLGALFTDVGAFGGAPGLAVLEPDGVHPLVSAVARALADHRPLVLSPDAVWLTIAAGVAHHVRLSPGTSTTG